MGIFEHKNDEDFETSIKHGSEDKKSGKKEVIRAHNLWIWEDKNKSGPGQSINSNESKKEENKGFSESDKDRGAI